MKIFIPLLLMLSFAAMSSCSDKTTIASDAVENTEQEPAPVLDQKTVTGSFKSVIGVMDELSCFCANGGYVTAEDGTTTVVCFDEEVESCDKITVTGYVTSRSIESNGVCPGGTMGFLKAQTYIVGETDY